MKISKNETAWVDLVKLGRLDEAFGLYIVQNPSFHLSQHISLRILTMILSYPLVAYIKMFRPSVSVSDTETDLSVEFLIFWKRPNVIGRHLFSKIIKSFLKTGKCPARPLAWYAHWLVFQGKYKQSGSIFRYLISRVPKNSRLYGEILSLTGNHFYSRDKLELSLYFHKRSDEILKDEGDQFFQMFNIGTSAKSYAELGRLEGFNKNILGSYDHLNPNEPDERYGMRVLIYSSYLNFIHGNTDLGKQYYSSAEKSFRKSGSPLDKAIYCTYKSAVLLFLKDLVGAREAISQASLFLRSYGRYKTYEQLIASLNAYLTNGISNPRITRNFLLNDNSSLRSELEAWYEKFFSGLLPILERFQNDDICNIKAPLEALTASVVTIELISPEVHLEHVNGIKFEIVDSHGDATAFRIDLFHSGKQYELVLKSHYRKWRNPEIVEAIRSILVLLQSLSRQEQLQKISSVQSQKIKESEVARRIAHDIRSPLAALNVAVSGLNPAVSNYNIIKSSTQRIEDIVNSLSRKRNSDSLKKEEKLLIKSFLDTLIASKRFEIHNSKSEIYVSYEDNAASKYVNVNETELGRTISNIINNALEAYSGDGVVEVLVHSTHSNLSIDIKDSGCGIDSALINCVFDKDFSSKKSGSGLGLYYAKQFADACNGTIHIETELGKGTTVRIELPVSMPPPWIKTNLFLGRYENVIILDDFLPNVEMMKESILRRCPYKKVMTFSNITDFIEMAGVQCLKDSSFFIIDYDFVNSDVNGIDLILEKNIQRNSVLATHHFENPDVIKKCLDNQIKIVPKIIFEQIEIEDSKPNVVIADDEKYFLKAIKSRLESFCEIHLFEEAEGMIDKVKTFNGNPYFFLDRNFKESHLRGEDLILALKELGDFKLFNISGDSSFHHKDAIKMSKSEIVEFLS